MPCEALAAGGWTLHKESEAQHHGDPSAVWGQLRGAKQLVEKSRHFYRLDHAYRGRLDYYRMTRNDFQPGAMVSRPADRWEVLKKRYGLKVGPWREGREVVVALSMPKTYEFFGVANWRAKLEAEIKQHTARPVVFRERKDANPIESALRTAHCLVTYASNTAVDALLAGVPVVVLGPSITRPLSGKLPDLENPLKPDNREEFFRHMAYCQFDIAEFRSGFARACADEVWDTAMRCSAAA